MHGVATSAGVNIDLGQPEDLAFLQLLLDNVVDYEVVLLTADGHVASWHAGAERLKGYTADEIVGQPFDRFYTDDIRVAGKPGRLLQVAREEGRVEDESWLVRKDGSCFRANVVITALRDEARALRGFLSITRALRRRAGEERGVLLQSEQ